ncbi:MAG: hypothetical protein OXS47_00260 [Chloroflexota bacterium]|nr:hypothetical protein [Chloroflexota bacterium]
MSVVGSEELDVVEPATIIAEAMHKLGVDAPEDKLLEAAKGVWRGIGSEWEFAALAVWGGARLVQRVDSGQWTPEATSKYKTPDLLVVVPTAAGNDVAFWVEVKTSRKEKIRVSERDFARMKAFQATTGLPSLMAYKHRGHIWSLREVETLHRAGTAYRLDLSDMYDNLMGVLLNDFAFAVREGTGLYIVLERQDGRLAEEAGEATFTVVDAYFGDADGNRLDSHPWMLYALLALDPVEKSDFSGSKVTMSFTSPGIERSAFGHNIFGVWAWLHHEQAGEIPWGAVLRRAQHVPPASEVAHELYARGFASHIIHQRPRNVSETFKVFA